MGRNQRARFGRRKQVRRPRRLQIEQLECRFVLNGQAILAGDAFSVRQNGPQQPLLVLANDTFEPNYAGQRLITSVSFGSQGGRLAISADKKSVLYTPPADFAGTETFVYAVDGRHTAQVEVNILATLANDSYQVPPDGNERRSLNVLENDPFWSGYTGPKRITSISVGTEGGTVAIAPDGQSILYTPADGVAGNERFTYVVDDLYPAEVSINIPNPLHDNNYEFVKYESPRTLEATADDLFWPGYAGEKKITHVEASRVGATIQISSDGKSLIYTQPASFGEQDYAYQLNDMFRYVVDGKYEAYVSIVLHRPVQDDSFAVDENSQDFFFDVTSNDTYREAQSYTRDVIDSVTSVTQSTHGGIVTISPDGKGILYTPAAGFTGDDDFTYTADGVHVVRVSVQVTRPVRDDEMIARQDTPNTELNLLFNDFKGNGYSGAKQITAVGQTEHGGKLSIRADGKAILTPAPGYTGPDQFTYTVDGSLEATVTLQVAPLAQPDSLRAYPEPGDRPFTIDVLRNDYFSQGYAGAGVITSVEVVSGSGQVSIQNQKIVFNPTSAGSHSLRYIVDGKYEGVVSVWVENVAFGDWAVVNENSEPKPINVLANDFYINYPRYSYSGPRVITGVTQSSHGGTVTISADGKTVDYEPTEDFVGTDTFTYTIDDFMTATVTVNVIRRVRDDEFRVDTADGPQNLPVLVNDPFGADYSGPGQITAVTATTGGGTVAISADGRSVVYTPQPGFVGTDTFVYTVDGTQKAEVSVVVDKSQSELAPKFDDLNEYVQFLIDEALTRYDSYFGRDAYGLVYTTLANYDAVVTSGAAADTRGHSETNIQVVGVDEDDLVEFDSDFIYTLTGGDLTILNAWPAEELSIASRLEIQGTPIGMFLNGDRLTIISAPKRSNWPLSIWGGDSIDTGYSSPGFSGSTIVTVVDVSDRSAPDVVQETTMDGRYVDSRAVDGTVYVLVENSNAVAPQPLIIDEDNDPATVNRYETREEYVARLMANQAELIEAALPGYTSSGSDGETVRTGLLNSPETIYKPLTEGATNLISVVSFNSSSDEPGVTNTSAVYTTGANTVYASLDHFYVFDATTSPEDGAVTRVMKFDWQPETGGIGFNATTTVPGSIINQFSVDESEGYLRIATNVENYRSGNWTSRAENTLFVLQEDDGVFEYVGGLQNLALNESIRSVRFMGDRAFITTFRDIDPLFAIDLSDPTRPESIGHITLPGFTSYMQLIDENHLLAVGKNTPFGNTGPTQVSLFDISNLLQPLRIAEFTFDRFSTSEAQVDHHAFGYYAECGMLAMPVSTAHVKRVDLDGDGFRETSQTVNEYELAVFSIDVNANDSADRLRLTTQIEHNASVRRSGFIGDKLYSIADDSVKAVAINSPEVEIASVEIPRAPGENGFVVFIDPNASGLISDLNLTHLNKNTPATNVPEQLRDPMSDAIARVRSALADRIGGEVGEPLVISAEADASEAQAFFVVCRVGEQNYLYVATADGATELVDADYQFDETAGVWHGIHKLASQTIVTVAPEVPTEFPPSETPASETSPIESPSNGSEQEPVVFAQLSADRTDLRTQRQFRPNIRQQLNFANNSQLLIVTQDDVEAQWRHDEWWGGLSDDLNSDDGDFGLADVDDAFESLSVF